jgi:hypothetical protein
MGKRKRRQKRPPDHELLPEDVLSGRVNPDVISLLRLVHRVNPTQDTGLSRGEVVERYRVKSQLQSLLVERFLDQLILVPDPEDDTIVGIRHRWGEGDACHAVVSELEPAARSKLLHALDTGGLDGPGAAEPEPDPDLGADDSRDEHELVVEARTAIEEYDFDSAHRLLNEALRRSHGAAEAAIALLELLLDHLADPAEAVAVQPRLSPEAAAEPEVRTLLALAAARVDEARRAEGLIRGVDDPRLPEVHLALARAAVRAGEPEAAGHWLHEAHRGGVEEAITGPVADAIDRLRDDKVGRLEQRLEKTEDEVAAEQLARSILDSGHDSQLARQVLRRLERERRQREVEEQLAAADDAESDGELARAASLLRRVQELDPERAGRLGERVRSLEQADRRRRDAELVRRVVTGLTGEERRGGLESYLELEPALRGRVREAVDSEMCGWLDQIEPPPVGARARAAVEAVIALARALELLSAGRAGEVIAALAPHMHSLGGVDDAAGALAEARARVAEEARARAGSALEEAQQAAEAGDHEAALRLVGAIDAAHLSGDQHERAQELAQRAAARLEAEQATARVDALCRSGDVLAARDQARHLAERGLASDREAWRQRVVELDVAVRDVWAYEEVEQTAKMTPRGFWPPADSVAPVQLTGDDRLVVASCQGRWVFLWLVSVASGAVERAISLRCPEPLDPFADVVVTGGGVWITDRLGNALHLKEEVGVCRWLRLDRVVVSTGDDDHYSLVPCTDHVWCRVYREHGDNVAQVFQLDRDAPPRTVSEADVVHPVVGHPDHLVMVSRFALLGRLGPLTALYHPRGSGGDRQEVVIPGHESAQLAVLHPDGARVVLAIPGEPQHSDGAVPIQLQVLLPGGVLGTAAVIEGSDHEARYSIATSVEAQRVFVVYPSQSVDLLVALRPDGDGFAEEYCVPVSQAAFLAQDDTARRVVLVQPLQSDQLVLPLSSEVPDVEPRQHPGRLPMSDPVMICGRTRGQSGARRVAFMGMIEDHEETQRAAVVSRMARDHENDPDAIVDLAQAVDMIGHGDLADEVLSGARSRHPDSTSLRLERAGRAADRREWTEVSRALEGGQPTDLEDHRARHYHHLLGIARLCQGDPEAACEAWRAGLVHDGECDLDSLQELADAMRSREVSADPGAGGSLAARLAAVIRFADLALSRGDDVEVIAALDRPWVRRAEDIQSTLRLAEAYLRHEGSDAAYRFDKRLCLATLCSMHEHADVRRSGFDLTELAWPPDRVDETVERAGAWLDTQEPPNQPSACPR